MYEYAWKQYNATPCVTLHAAHPLLVKPGSGGTMAADPLDPVVSHRPPPGIHHVRQVPSYHASNSCVRVAPGHSTPDPSVAPPGDPLSPIHGVLESCPHRATGLGMGAGSLCT
ncbi:hypothetical protein JB92DRAFT_2828557 [Gautieria morchelliformis]|nr:hypothetical protein JB92DRAFT_2828557 [Gautieria morchelliformis]